MRRSKPTRDSRRSPRTGPRDDDRTNASTNRSPGGWRQTAPSRLPERVLEATFERTRRSRQQVGWRARPWASPGAAIRRSCSAVRPSSWLAGRAGAAASPSTDRTWARRPAAPLPTTPDAWSRVVIDAGPRAASTRSSPARVGCSRPWAKARSPDCTSRPTVATGRACRPIEHPPVGTNGAALVATDQGFLMVGNEVFASEDGLSWRRIASPAEDPDLRAGHADRRGPGGPGFVAVGSDNMAWYSTDGTDWTLAEVPPPLGEPSQTGASSGSSLSLRVSSRCWASPGRAAVLSPGERPTGSTTTDRRPSFRSCGPRATALTWTNVPAPQPTRYATVTGGPHGFALREPDDDRSVWLVHRWHVVGARRRQRLRVVSLAGASKRRWPPGRDVRWRDRSGGCRVHRGRERRHLPPRLLIRRDGDLDLTRWTLVVAPAQRRLVPGSYRCGRSDGRGMGTWFRRRRRVRRPAGGLDLRGRGALVPALDVVADYLADERALRRGQRLHGPRGRPVRRDHRDHRYHTPRCRTGGAACRTTSTSKRPTASSEESVPGAGLARGRGRRERAARSPPRSSRPGPGPT